MRHSPWNHTLTGQGPSCYTLLLILKNNKQLHLVCSYYINVYFYIYDQAHQNSQTLILGLIVIFKNVRWRLLFGERNTLKFWFRVIVPTSLLLNRFGLNCIGYKTKSVFPSLSKKPFLLIIISTVKQIYFDSITFI